MIRTITQPTAVDVSMMVDHVKAFLVEDRGSDYVNHFADFSFDRAKLISFIMKSLGSSGYFTRVVKTENGEILGGMMGMISSPCFSHDLIAKELILYLAPDQSDLSVLFDLIEAFTKWAEDLKVKELQIANSTGYKPEKFALLMKRKGLVPFETGYMKRI